MAEGALSSLGLEREYLQSTYGKGTARPLPLSKGSGKAVRVGPALDFDTSPAQTDAVTKRQLLPTITRAKDGTHVYLLVGDKPRWLVHYRMVSQDGRPVVAEIRVTPPAGELPLGGVPARVLREITLELAYDALRSVAETYVEGRSRDQHGPVPRTRQHDKWNEWLLGGSLDAILDTPHRPGRQGRSDLFYARIAEAYVALCDAGNRAPIRDLAARLREKEEWYSDESVRQLVNKARNRGLLTESPPGRSGGQLTQKARDLLGPEHRKRRRGRK